MASKRAVAVAVAVARDIAVDFDVGAPSKLAAPSCAGEAEEAPLSERSEFGRRASSACAGAGTGEAGERPVRAVLVTFATTKVTRASARKPLSLLWLALLLRSNSSSANDDTALKKGSPGALRLPGTRFFTRQCQSLSDEWISLARQ